MSRPICSATRWPVVERRGARARVRASPGRPRNRLLIHVRARSACEARKRNGPSCWSSRARPRIPHRPSAHGDAHRRAEPRAVSGAIRLKVTGTTRPARGRGSSAHFTTPQTSTARSPARKSASSCMPGMSSPPKRSLTSRLRSRRCKTPRRRVGADRETGSRSDPWKTLCCQERCPESLARETSRACAPVPAHMRPVPGR